MSPWPMRLGIARTSMPGVDIGTRKIAMPLLPCAPALVRASRKQWCAIAAYEVQILVPLIT